MFLEAVSLCTFHLYFQGALSWTDSQGGSWPYPRLICTVSGRIPGLLPNQVRDAHLYQNVCFFYKVYEVYRRVARHSPRAEANIVKACNTMQWSHMIS